MLLPGDAPGAGDEAAVRLLLGRDPQGEYAVAVRDSSGAPVVLCNAPLLRDGTPMPTFYWLCGHAEVAAVSRLEADGAVDEAEAAIGLDALDDIHRRYAAMRDAHMPAGHTGPAPSGGVGGTRRGVKCLHAHFGWWLAGGDDAVDAWVAERLAGAGVRHAGRVS